MIASWLAGRFVQLAPKPVAEHRSANGDEFPVEPRLGAIHTTERPGSESLLDEKACIHVATQLSDAWISEKSKNRYKIN